MKITRHILTMPGTNRRVHYRRCGSGPALLMIHQSPRSSAEYEPLMLQWGAHFTCIAPDTPGFGQSDALPGEPDIGDFAVALGEFVHALGLERCATYGFHSGGVILVETVRHFPQLFSCLALGAYAIWDDADMALFSEGYLAPFLPSAYGEHLTWLWNRILEQNWFFPWFDARDIARLPDSHADVQRVQNGAMELLDAGDSYRWGYGAILHAPRKLPFVENGPTGLITAYDDDPLQVHIDRLDRMPDGWAARKVSQPEDHLAQSLAFLLEEAGNAPCPALAEDSEEGWFAHEGGLLHWRGERGGRLQLHAPAGEMIASGPGEIAIDAPGHGQSSDFADPLAAVEAFAEAFAVSAIDWPAPPSGDPELLYPDLTPDRFGSHFQRAWTAARAQAFFAPWYAADDDHVLPIDPAETTPAAIHARALARLRAGMAARTWHEALAQRSA